MTGEASRQKLSQDSIRVGERLRQALSRWVRTTREQARTPSMATMETLRLLHDGGPATISNLARTRFVKHQSMRLVVEQLVREKVVIKQVLAADRRNQLVSITRSGRAALRKEQRIRALWIAQLLESRNPDEINQVEIALDILEEILDSAFAGSTVKQAGGRPAR